MRFPNRTSREVLGAFTRSFASATGRPFRRVKVALHQWAHVESELSGRLLASRPYATPVRVPYTSGANRRIFVLPDSKNRPPLRCQKAIRLAITGSVLLHLRGPVLGIRLRDRVVLGTSVPETAVHEHGQTCAGEDQVGRAPDRSDRPHRHPVPHAHRVDRTPQSEFGPGVAPLVGLHASTRGGRGGPRARRSLSVGTVSHRCLFRRCIWDGRREAARRSSCYGLRDAPLLACAQ
jgi:hypothetical protein